MNGTPIRTPTYKTFLTAAGWALLLAWTIWWGISFREGSLKWAHVTRVPAWEFLGYDFEHNYLAVQFWTAGGNPFLDTFGDGRGKYAYPPVVLVFYVWCAALGRHEATAVWMTAVAVGVAGGVLMAWRTRKQLGLSRLPLVVLIAAALCSMPVLFAMERGQGDVIALAMIILVSLALQRQPSWGRDLLIGTAVGLAAWTKVYPGILIPGLLALGAWRAGVLSVVQSAVIALVPYRATLLWLKETSASQRDRVGFLTEIIAWLKEPNHRPAELQLYAPITVDSHSLTTYWATFWNYFDLYWLARMPGVVGAALVLFPAATWLSIRVYRSADRTLLAYPYLLWVTALGTFWMPVSFDYNLLYLVVATLAVCAWRDSWVVAASLIAAALWWQPFRVPVPGASDALFFLKLFSLAGVAISIVARSRAANEIETRGDIERPDAPPP